MAEPTVFLCDDDEGVRASIAFLLRQHDVPVASFASGAQLLDMLRTTRPLPRGICVLDVRMDPMSGLRLHDELNALGVRNPVMFLSGHGDIPMVVEALKKGAFDFLEKLYSDNALVDRIEQALAVEAATYVNDARESERKARLASLSDREREVMTRVAAGKLNKVIADDLHIAVRTVEVHRARVFSKLGVRSAAELAGWLATG